jgi:hypothetical protein
MSSTFTDTTFSAPRKPESRHRQRLQRSARIASCLALAGALVILGAEAWLAVEPATLLTMDGMRGMASEGSLGPARLAALWFVQFVPAVLLAMAMLVARRLFSRWSEAQLFPAEAPRLLRLLGHLSIASALSGTMARTLAVLILTSDRPPGHHELTIGISSSEIGGIVFGLLLSAIALVMREAILIEQEMREFI